MKHLKIIATLLLLFASSLVLAGDDIVCQENGVVVKIPINVDGSAHEDSYTYYLPEKGYPVCNEAAEKAEVKLYEKIYDLGLNAANCVKIDSKFIGGAHEFSSDNDIFSDDFGPDYFVTCRNTLKYTCFKKLTF